MLAQRGTRLVQTRNYSDEMKLTFAAANQVFYDKSDVKQIDVPTLSGAFGILPKHVPTLAVLQPGVVNVFEKDGSTKKFFVSSGTVTVNNDSSVQVLAEEAHPLENLDSSAARECLTKAQQELSSAASDVVSYYSIGIRMKVPRTLLTFQFFQAKAEAAIAVEVSEALVKATA